MMAAAERLGVWLLQSSVALVVSATTAAVWCACLPRSRARLRHAVWFGALAVAVLAPMLVHARVALGVLGPAAASQDPALPLPSLSTAFVGAWGVGVLVMLSRLVAQHVALWHWARGLDPMHHDCTAAVSPQYDTHWRRARTPSVLRGAPGAMPVCWGILRPRIMLPADAVGWSDEMTRIVLRHELAHIDRHDPLGDLLARVIMAFLWFHPLAWLVNARIRIERERACDERVVGSGIDPVRYVEQLLVLARTTRPVPIAAAVARRSMLEERAAALLAADRRCRRRGDRLAVAVAVVLVALPPALVTPALQRATPVVPDVARSSPQLPGSHPGSFRTSLVGGVR